MIERSDIHNSSIVNRHSISYKVSVPLARAAVAGLTKNLTLLQPMAVTGELDESLEIFFARVADDFLR